MKSIVCKLFILATFCATSIAQSPILNPNFTVNATVELAGTNISLGDITSQASIQGSAMSRSCLLLTRQKGKWQTINNKTGSVTFGGYEAAGATTAANFQTFGIANGALINPILDVSAASDIDLDVWFTVDYNSPCVALYECTGSLFKYTYRLKGYNCGTLVPKNGQCGGMGYTGSTLCAAGSTCKFITPFFSQCL